MYKYIYRAYIHIYMSREHLLLYLLLYSLTDLFSRSDVDCCGCTYIFLLLYFWGLVYNYCCYFRSDQTLQNSMSTSSLDLYMKVAIDQPYRREDRHHVLVCLSELRPFFSTPTWQADEEKIQSPASITLPPSLSLSPTLCFTFLTVTIFPLSPLPRVFKVLQKPQRSIWRDSD